VPERFDARQRRSMQPASTKTLNRSIPDELADFVKQVYRLVMPSALGRCSLPTISVVNQPPARSSDVRWRELRPVISNALARVATVDGSSSVRAAAREPVKAPCRPRC
jgi:hypothetical protein